MGERRGHFAHFVEAGQSRQLGLNLLQASGRFFTLGQVAYKTREKPSTTRSHLPDGKFHGKGRSVLSLTDDNTVGSDNSLLARREVPLEIAAVFLAIGLRHQHPQVLADHLIFGIAELPDSRGVE
ncbi:hypothetical protein D9M69_534850 [compost metagenome]